MRPSRPTPLRHRCSCGARVNWERRTTWRGDRWLGICTNASCGRFTTQLADGPEDPDGLAEFLLDGSPVVPDTPPQVRLFLRHGGMGWRHHHEPCHACDGRLVMALALERDDARPADPQRILLCLDCAYLVVQAWMFGEAQELHVPPEGWEQPATAVLIVKRALEARSGIAAADPRWDIDA